MDAILYTEQKLTLDHVTIVLASVKVTRSFGVCGASVLKHQFCSKQNRSICSTVSTQKKNHVPF